MRYAYKVEALFTLYCEPIVISINYYHADGKIPDDCRYTGSPNVGCHCMIKLRAMKNKLGMNKGSLFERPIISIK
jgi:hypothetical protein